ncbi:hypothetical protein QYE76_070332 [Lolium multiflorum]|uniref:Protein TIFY n=1 Tax=Lolium multiflorum TaxID=4521 RepID=A0AAD8SJZ5_LOLMU|nr:hypothetical protein QYE76_070332 [Lolium multiflorum]
MLAPTFFLTSPLNPSIAAPHECTIITNSSSRRYKEPASMSHPRSSRSIEQARLVEPAEAIDRHRRNPPSRRSRLASTVEMPPMATATTDSAAATRRFAVACGVLSRFVKAAGPVAMPMPMSAYGAGAVQGPDGRPADGGQQLTIFYGGRVVVLDGCTPAMAAELIQYAAAAAATPTAAAPATELVDIPIARKASLQRFLSKRKHRSVTALDGPPYSHPQEAAPPPPAKKRKTEASSWLALGVA